MDRYKLSTALLLLGFVFGVIIISYGLLHSREEHMKQSVRSVDDSGIRDGGGGYLRIDLKLAQDKPINVLMYGSVGKPLNLSNLVMQT